MGSGNSPEVETTPLIGMCRALDLLATAAGERFTHPWATVRAAGHTAPRGRACRGSSGLVRLALSLVQVDENDLVALRDHRVRDLYARGRLVDRLTVGAMVVLDAAQQGEQSGQTWGEALDHAMGAAGRFLDLMPDRLFMTATGDESARRY